MRRIGSWVWLIKYRTEGSRFVSCLRERAKCLIGAGDWLIGRGSANGSVVTALHPDFSEANGKQGSLQAYKTQG